MKTISRILIVLLIVGVPLAALSNPGEGREHGRMMKGLDLTDEQQAQVQQLRLEHQKEMMTLNDEMHSLRTQMKLLTTEDKPSTSEIETLAGKIGTAQVCCDQVGIFQIGPGKIGIGQICFRQANIAENGPG